MSPWGAIANTLKDSLLGYIPSIILTWLIPKSKILGGILISQTGGTLADTYVPPDGQAIKNMSFTIHNHLPFPVDVESIQGKASQSNSTLIQNFSMPVNLEIEEHSTTEFKGQLDLPQRAHDKEVN